MSRAEFPRRGSQDEMSIEVSLANLGIAPFYHDWECELAAIPASRTGQNKKINLSNMARNLENDWHSTQR